jgi:phospholipid/cholesterol/gamma-HCH transport system substrate-binding protein
MARKKISKLAIGMFVTGGIVIGVVAVIWLGASHFFEGGARYVTYFDESVQGLNPDSTVKYRGVDIGRVEKISVAPDLRLIQVVMKVNLSEDNARQTYAQLKTAGLTGIVFIDLDRKSAENNFKSPQLSFKPPFPIIESRPSTTTQIMAGLDLVLTKTRDLDLKGMVEEFKAVQKSIESFLAGPKTKSIIANVDDMTAHLDNTARNIDRIVAESRFDEIMKETRQTVTEIRTLMTKLRQDYEMLRVGELDKKTREIAADIKVTSENLRQASVNFDMLVEELQANPSEIIFSKPPPARYQR